MKILRVDMKQLKATYEELPEEWRLLGGRALIAKIMKAEVSPKADPLGVENKLIITAGPLAGTMAPHLGRISIGSKSPLTKGIKEANAGGTAAQKMDKLGIRAIIIENAPSNDKYYLLKIDKGTATLLPADEYRGLKNYVLIDKLFSTFNKKAAVISIGIAGERRYKAATVSLTDMLGDPSRNAARGGLGAVMGSKGIKAIIIDDTGAPPIVIADNKTFKSTVADWVDKIKRDIGCGLFSTFGTSFVVRSNNRQGTMPSHNYTSGSTPEFEKVSQDVLRQRIINDGGRFHGCMPGCVVQCSVIYNGPDGQCLCSAYEYEGIAMLGTNLDILDHNAIARLKHICDDLGVDLIEIGSALGVAASAGKMEWGSEESAAKLFGEIEQGTEFGKKLADGVVATANALGVKRIPAIRGQAIPGHDARAVKGIGVTYATSPMGADHTAGLTYRQPTSKTGQIENSLRFQIQCAAADAFGYCINAVPGGQASLYEFLASLINARFGLSITRQDVMNIGKQTIRDELAFNHTAGLEKVFEYPAFIKEEAISPSNQTFDIPDEELNTIWDKMGTFVEKPKSWEVRFPVIPDILFGVGVINQLGARAKKLGISKALLICGSTTKRLGYADQFADILKKSGVESAIFSEGMADPPLEEIEKIGQIYKAEGCDGLIALGGGSNMDAAKAAAIRVSHSGILTEFDSAVGGGAKIKNPLPPLICIPMTAGTGSEVNQFSIITDTERGIKLIYMSNRLVPKLAVVDPGLCVSMPAGLTAQTGVDALSHCIEGYVAMSTPYHPYYESLGLYGAKLVGRSLRKAVANGEDLDARKDISMAAMMGGICFAKGLGLGHALGHAIGEHYHIPHGKAVAIGLLCFVRVNAKVCTDSFAELSRILNRQENLELALQELFKDIGMPIRISELGIPESALEVVAFEASKDVPNLTSNPVPMLKYNQILELLKEFA